MSVDRSYVHSRFGPVVAKWHSRACCAFLLAGYSMAVIACLALPEQAPFAAVRWIGIGLSCAGVAMVWRMWRSSPCD